MDVEILCTGFAPLNIVVNTQGLNVYQISFRSLQKYYPKIYGLTFNLNGITTIIVPNSDNYLELNSDINSYTVQFKQEPTLSAEDTFIKEFFQGRYTYQEICKMMFVKHKCPMSLSTLKRKLRLMNLRRKGVCESSLEEIIAAIYLEIQASGLCLGYRSMWQRLKTKYKLSVKCSTVLKYMHIIDPVGIERRSRYRLKRREYEVPGPNFTWHVDGFDKLKKFGMAISGCVCGFSRKVIWLKVGTTNNKPQVIAHHYLEAVKEHSLVPTIVRSDRGTENSLICVLQRILRRNHEDEDAKVFSFIKGKSTANERIEKHWKHLINSGLDFYRKLFKSMVKRKLMDNSDMLQVEILRFCFGPVVTLDLERAAKEWNEHRIRRQRNIKSPCGIPNIMFFWPEKYGAKDCKKPIDLREVEILFRQETEAPKLYDPRVEQLLKILLPTVKAPTTAFEAFETFLVILQKIKARES